MRPAIVFRTANGSLPPELLDYDGLDAFKHYFMTLPSLIFSGILLLLHTVSNMVWARCQRKLVLHLKGPLPTSERVKPPKDDSKCAMMAVLLHISMYIDFIEVQGVGWVVTWELLMPGLASTTSRSSSMVANDEDAHDPAKQHPGTSRRLDNYIDGLNVVPAHTGVVTSSASSLRISVIV
ncbi:hypothetical protein TgHK011_002243 [Trichoderma gracile]|nr:hypothetical protein TgHK011_002243 [Trichoderma gracile]